MADLASAIYCLVGSGHVWSGPKERRACSGQARAWWQRDVSITRAARLRADAGLSRGFFL